MRYTRHILLLPLLVTLLGCSTNLSTSDAFEIGITYPKATGLLFEVIPQTNDYYYSCDAVSVEDFEKWGEEVVIDSIDALNKEVYGFIKELYDGAGLALPSFHDMLENGAIYGVLEGLEPETNYYLCITCYDKRNRPIAPIAKQPFRTKDSLVSTITFNVDVEGTAAIIKPSNEEMYFWNVISKEDLDRRYLGMPSYFYSESVENYERYGFISTMLDQDVDTAHVLHYVNMTAFDTAYLVMAGYYNETNSQVSAYELVYQRGDTFSIRTLENAWDVYSTSVAERKARCLFRKNAIRPRL